MNKIIISILCIFIANLSFSQTSPSHPQPRFIEMTGRAEIEVVPDEIYILISIQEKIKKSDNSEIEAKEKAMVQALNNIKVDLRFLSLKDEHSGYATYWKRRNEILKNKDFILKLKDAKMIGLVFQEMDKIDIEHVYIIEVKHSKQDSLKKEMRIQAIKAAKEKVDYLLTAIGETKDKLMEVNEVINEDAALRNVVQNTNNNYILTMGGSTYDIGGGLNNTNTVPDFRKIKISSSIYLKYSIK